MQRYAYTTRYTYTMILRNDSKNFTAQYMANKRNNCDIIHMFHSCKCNNGNNENRSDY